MDDDQVEVMKLAATDATVPLAALHPEGCCEICDSPEACMAGDAPCQLTGVYAGGRFKSMPPEFLKLVNDVVWPHPREHYGAMLNHLLEDVQKVVADKEVAKTIVEASMEAYATLWNSLHKNKATEAGAAVEAAVALFAAIHAVCHLASGGIPSGGMSVFFQLPAAVAQLQAAPLYAQLLANSEKTSEKDKAKLKAVIELARNAGSPVDYEQVNVADAIAQRLKNS